MTSAPITNARLRDLAVLEAAERALAKAKRGKSFDPELFQAVAEHELQKLWATI